MDGNMNRNLVSFIALCMLNIDGFFILHFILDSLSSDPDEIRPIK